MAPLKIACQCGKTLSVPEHLLGKKVRCPGCGAVLVAQAPQAVEPENGFEVDDGYTADDSPPLDTAPTDTPMRFCKSCGASLQLDAVVCLECGVNQETGDRVGSLSGKAASSARANAWGGMVAQTLLLVAILGGIGAGFYFYHKSTSKPADKPQATDAAKPSPKPQPEAKPEPTTQPTPGAVAKKPAPSAAKAAPGGVPKGATVRKRENIFGSDNEWALGRYVRAPRRARDRTAVDMANRSINMFTQAEGRKPKSLKEVVDAGYGPLNQPSGGLKLALDPKTGKAVLYEPPK